MTTARRGRISLLATLAPWILLATAFAGGPLTLGGPSNGTPGQALGWNPAAMPIQYRIDVGPMSTTFGGQIAVTNAIGCSGCRPCSATGSKAHTLRSSINTLVRFSPTPASLFPMWPFSRSLTLCWGSASPIPRAQSFSMLTAGSFLPLDCRPTSSASPRRASSTQRVGSSIRRSRC